MNDFNKSALLLTFFALVCTVFVQGQESSKGDVLKHVVLFKFKDSSSVEDVNMICKAFAGLKEKISLIKAFEWGENSSPEGLNQGLTHCFVADFSSDSDRDAYLIHPAHKDFVTLIGPHLDKVTVVDYWVK